MVLPLNNYYHEYYSNLFLVGEVSLLKNMISDILFILIANSVDVSETCTIWHPDATATATAAAGIGAGTGTGATAAADPLAVDDDGRSFLNLKVK